MNTLEELKQAIKDKVCDKRHNIVGLVELTRIKNGAALRRLNAMGNFNPISYDRELLVFFTINDSVFIDKAKTLPLKVTMVILTEDYNDISLIIEALDEYEFLPAEITFGSQSLYDRYFDLDPNKPFQGYAFEINLNIRISYKELFIQNL